MGNEIVFVQIMNLVHLFQAVFKKATKKKKKNKQKTKKEKQAKNEKRKSESTDTHKESNR